MKFRIEKLMSCGLLWNSYGDWTNNFDILNIGVQFLKANKPTEKYRIVSEKGEVIKVV